MHVVVHHGSGRETRRYPGHGDAQVEVEVLLDAQHRVEPTDSGEQPPVDGDRAEAHVVGPQQPLIGQCPTGAGINDGVRRHPAETGRPEPSSGLAHVGELHLQLGGSQASSWSRKHRIGAVVSRTPAFRAMDTPAFFWRTRRTRASTRSTQPRSSVPLSSTTTSSHSTWVWATTLCTARRSSPCESKVGMMMAASTAGVTLGHRPDRRCAGPSRSLGLARPSRRRPVGRTR